MRNGEQDLNYGAHWGKLGSKIKTGKEHWQAQAMAMSVDIIGIGATLGNALTRAR